MEEKRDVLRAKIEDYSRFLVTLLIVSGYFYIGMLIHTYMEPDRHKAYFLIVLLLVSLFVAGYFAMLLKKWTIRIQNDESIE
ncbi:YrhC family protein [Radiobacillus kanasensis]|uniref:YrhC family protein n=1 Tax=Radiobacillus kanasensis TaxID=2844358 RepID=UPI001E59D958|nr:YrhC family protein [Radiobacillus kanasensis]UFT97857.1 YrhC family protein [Radiobacillus kanasensis]